MENWETLPQIPRAPRINMLHTNVIRKLTVISQIIFDSIPSHTQLKKKDPSASENFKERRNLKFLQQQPSNNVQTGL